MASARPNPVRHYDHIVVGAGIIGSCTALQLVRGGASVLLLEKFPLPHSRGSSHGQSRGIRRAYTDPYFTGLMEEAYREWHGIEEEAGTTLIRETGLLCFSDSPASPWLGAITASLAAQGARHSLLSGETFRQQFPCLQFPGPVAGCLDPTAGVLLADKALLAVQALVKAGGATLRDGITVTEVESRAGGVTVRGQGLGGEEEYTARSVVVSPGPWAGGLLQELGLPAPPLVTMKIPVYYWRAPHFLPHTFIFEDDAGNHIWGLPALEYPGLAKICLHEGPPAHPDSRDSVPTGAIRRQLEEFIRLHFPGVDPEVAVEESCMYTCTPDWNPVIDTVPGRQNIVLAVGFSGTGFKLGPVSGRMAAELARTGGRQQEPRLGLARLQGGRL